MLLGIYSTICSNRTGRPPRCAHGSIVGKWAIAASGGGISEVGCGSISKSSRTTGTTTGCRATTSSYSRVTQRLYLHTLKNIVFSFNKKGDEAAFWESEIAAASNRDFRFVPFNHGARLDPSFYPTAVELDRLYQAGDQRLFSLYVEFERCIQRAGADAVIVANCPPYHPDYLRRVPVYKALHSADDPGATYLINIPYLHAYEHVFFVSPTYSRDMEMKEKMRYAGKVNADWLPISVFDFECAPERSEDELFTQHRDIDIIYVGGFWRQKLPLLTKVRRAFGRRFRMYGFFGLKHNLYMKAR